MPRSSWSASRTSTKLWTYTPSGHKYATSSSWNGDKRRQRAMSEIGKALWATELADIPMPESATYADFHQLVAEKQRYEARRDQLRFIQSLQRIAAQRP